MDEHVKLAMSSPFFLSLKTPHPFSVSDSLSFSAGSPSDLTPFWSEQLKRTKQLLMGTTPFDSDRKQLSPPEIRSATGNLQISPLMSLMYQHNMGGSAWLRQFIFGFKLIGAFSQKHTFPRSEKLKNTTPISAQHIMQASSRRFTERARESGFKNAQPLWEEAMGQHRKGWLSKPSPFRPQPLPLLLGAKICT